MATSSRETTPVTTLPELQGPRFPVVVPDFVPVPTSWISYELEDSWLAHRRGRRPRSIATTIRWILVWQSLDQARIPPIVPDQLLEYCLYGRDGRNGWRNELRSKDGRPFVSVEQIAKRVQENQAILDQLTPVVQRIKAREQCGIQPSSEEHDAIERRSTATTENEQFTRRVSSYSLP